VFLPKGRPAGAMNARWLTQKLSHRGKAHKKSPSFGGVGRSSGVIIRPLRGRTFWVWRVGYKHAIPSGLCRQKGLTPKGSNVYRKQTTPLQYDPFGVAPCGCGVLAINMQSLRDCAALGVGLCVLCRRDTGPCVSTCCVGVLIFSIECG